MRKQSEKGFIIFTSLVIVFVISAIAAALLTSITSGTKRELNQDYESSSREIANAALDLSLNALRQATDGVDNDGDGTVDEDITDPNIFDPAVVAKIEGNLGRIGTLGWVPGSDVNGNGLPDIGEPGVVPIAIFNGEAISYSVFSEMDGLDNDGDGTTDEADESGSILIMVQGRYQRRTSAIRYSGLFTEIYSPPPPPSWVPDTAFVTGGSLTVLGNCTVTGTEGNIHSNGYLDLGGSSSIAGDATASGGGNVDPGNVGGLVDTAAPQVLLPNVNLSNMTGMREQARADGKDVYILNKDATISKNGAIVSVGGGYHGWNMAADGSWTLNGNQADLNGLFYAYGDVYTGGAKNPISMTVLAEGNITLNGNGKYTSYYDNVFLVTMKDLKLAGTPQESGNLGAIFVREQVFTEGTTFIRGVIMAADLDHASDYVTQNSISGTFEIEYNGGFSTSFPLFDPNSNQFSLDPIFCAYEER